MSAAVRKVTRREFLETTALAAGGLILAASLPLPAGEAAAPAVSAFGPFLRIGEDGSVTVVANHSEMGQGVYTSLPMIVAEELECDWSSVRVIAAPVDPAYNHLTFGPVQATGGSTSVSTEWERLAAVGAAARQMLTAAAAKEWRVDPGACRAASGVVTSPDGRTLTYAELAAAAAKLSVPKKIILKKRSEYRLIGTPVHRTDTPAKIAGSALFGIDVRERGMLTAVIARPPVFGARVRSFDAREAISVRGVRAVVKTPAGVAVAAETFWAAKKGRDLLQVEWDEGRWAALSTDRLREEYAARAQRPGMIARKEGNVDRALEQGARRSEAVYDLPYLAHACMEPLNCFVDLKKESCRILTGTQAQTDNRNTAAAIANLPRDRVTLETLFLGGGFGRRGNPASDFVSDAVHVAKQLRAPVKVIRTREDDMTAGWYRPLFVHRLEGALDAAGNPVAWLHRAVGQSVAEAAMRTSMIRNGIDNSSVEGAEDLPYAIANLRVELHTMRNGIPVQWWRSVGHSQTTFAVESFLDELADAGGKDPLELRRALLERRPRERAVLEAVAAEAGWGRPLPDGHGRGIAVHASYGSIVAQVAEVSADREGKVRVHKVWVAVDCGRFVNPDTIRAQLESAVVFGLSAALHGEITLDKGRVRQKNFDDYQVLRLNEMPEVAVRIVESGLPPGGIGEPGVPPIAPAVANALFAATGARVRSLPMTPEKVLAAQKKS